MARQTVIGIPSHVREAVPDSVAKLTFTAFTQYLRIAGQAPRHASLMATQDGDYMLKYNDSATRVVPVDAWCRFLLRPSHPTVRETAFPFSPAPKSG